MQSLQDYISDQLTNGLSGTQSNNNSYRIGSDDNPKLEPQVESAKKLNHDFGILKKLVIAYNKYANTIKELIQKNDSFHYVLEIIEVIDFSEMFGVKQQRITDPPKDSNSRDSFAEFVDNVDQSRISGQEQQRITPAEVIMQDFDCSMDLNKKAIDDDKLHRSLYRVWICEI
eukprot:403350258